MFTLSVCMIVKNEENVLDRILKCAKKFADEIIIVDTGSTDNTINIAKKYTNKVYSFKWVDDFSKARNKSFSYATKDYIMWLDADDFITNSQIKKIKELKKQTHLADVYMLKYVMGFVNNKPTLTFYRERIVKNNSGFNWVGFVHEVITPSGKIEYLDIEIEHRKLASIPSNPKRNLNLYRNALKNNYEFSARDRYYYARELYYNGFYKKALQEFKSYLKMNDNYYFNKLDTVIIISKIYLILKDYKKGINLILDFYKNNTPDSELNINLAQHLENIGDINSAIYWYHSALVCPKRQMGFVNPEVYDFIPYLELSRLYYNNDKYSYAKKYHNLAKAINPNHPSIIYNSKFFLS